MYCALQKEIDTIQILEFPHNVKKRGTKQPIGRGREKGATGSGREIETDNKQSPGAARRRPVKAHIQFKQSIHTA